MAPARRLALAVPVIALLACAIVLATRQSEGNPAEDVERSGLLLADRMDSPAAVKEAFAQLQRAIFLRPSSPYAWAALAAARYRAGVADETFRVALLRAAELGPNEPRVQDTVALYGLAVWPEAGPELRAAVDRMVAAGMRRDAPAMLQIAQRRGRLDSACRHIDASAALERKWMQACFPGAR